MKTNKIIQIMFLITANMIITAGNPLQASEKSFIGGVIVSEHTSEGVAFATIALFDSTGTTLLGGTSSDFNGEFFLEGTGYGQHILRVSAIGYKTIMKHIKINDNSLLALGSILLPDDEIALEEVVVTGQRIRASSGTDRNTYYVNQNMQKASSTGTDILKLIPGVHLDIRQNISLNGSTDILILVNGRERDRSFVTQLQASQIDRIEIIDTPPVQYDASISGVINIILAQNPERGVNGQIYAEIPTSMKETYIFPSYNLNFVTGRFNIFTSYNGEMSYFDIQEMYHRTLKTEKSTDEIFSTQYVRQENWSHRFHYGVDYLINEKNQLNFYGFVNPYSSEHTGNVELIREGVNPLRWTAHKDDNDMNNSMFYSVFYRHLFNPDNGHEISADVSFYDMRGENTIRYSDINSEYHQENTSSPLQQSVNIRVDYTRPLSEKVSLLTGVQNRQLKIRDSQNSTFGYDNNILAAHGSLSLNIGHFSAIAGIRAENAIIGQGSSLSNSTTSWLPGFSANYRFSSAQNLSFSYRKSISYPGFYQLNPNLSIEDPFTQHIGNPELQAVDRSVFTLEFSQRFENHFVASQLFFNKSNGVINRLSLLNEEGILETHSYNLGNIDQLGIQITSSLSLGKRGGLNPYFRLSEVFTTPNDIALSYNIYKRRQTAWETGFSAFYSPGRDYMISVMLKHSSPLNDIQSNYYEGTQYFLSVEKAFGQAFKAGIVSALPLTGSYTYRGSQVNAPDFDNLSEGAIQMSTVPVWFKLTWQFSSGTKRDRIARDREIIENERRKGF